MSAFEMKRIYLEIPCKNKNYLFLDQTVLKKSFTVPLSSQTGYNTIYINLQELSCPFCL